MEMERREVEHSIIHFADLELRQTIGVGSFAQIRLVVHKPSQVQAQAQAQAQAQHVRFAQITLVLHKPHVTLPLSR